MESLILSVSILEDETTGLFPIEKIEGETLLFFHRSSGDLICASKIEKMLVGDLTYYPDIERAKIVV